MALRPCVSLIADRCGILTHYGDFTGFTTDQPRAKPDSMVLLYVRVPALDTGLTGCVFPRSDRLIFFFFTFVVIYCQQISV